MTSSVEPGKVALMLHTFIGDDTDKKYCYFLIRTRTSDAGYHASYYF